jgi:phage protein D
VAEHGQFGTRPIITVDGSPLREELLPYLDRVTADMSLHLPDMVELRLRDEKRDVFKRSGIKIGSKLEVSGTPTGDGKQTLLVAAEVTALEHDFSGLGNVAVIRGYDVSHRLCRGRRTHSYNDVTDGDVVRDVAKRAGVDVGSVDDSGPTHDHVAQVNLTDWEFLLGRARECGAELAVADGKLHWRKPNDSADGPDPADGIADKPASLQLTLGANLRHFRPRVTSAAQVSEVEVRGWDPGRKEAVVGRAQAATTSVSAGMAPADLAGPFSPPPFVSVDRPLATQAEADAAASAIAETLASAHAEADGIALGDPRLKAGVAVGIGSAGWPYDGKYTLTTTRHVYDTDGYRVVFSVTGRQERSMLGLASNGSTNSMQRASGPPIYGVVVGQVTDVNDPDDLGRVKLKFPWLSDDYESWWARIAILGAGKDRGAVWLPEVNDEVLVAFEHGDTRRPYVVGSLWNGVDKPPLGSGLVDGSSGAVKRRGFVSKQGHRLVFLDDDSKSGIAVVSADDKLKIALNQSGTTISIKADGAVEISGSKSVKISSDGGITLDAGSSLELKAKSGVKIDGGPQVELSGQMIKLN